MNALQDNPKLISLQTAVEYRGRLAQGGKTLVMTNGVFDMLHPGHVYFLKKAAQLGDELIVMLNGESGVRLLKGPARPVLGNLERAYCLAALDCVSKVCIFEAPRLDAEIRALRPDIYTKAGDYAIETLDKAERAALEECGARIEFLPFLEGFSTTSLIEKIRRAAEHGKF